MSAPVGPGVVTAGQNTAQLNLAGSAQSTLYGPVGSNTYTASGESTLANPSTPVPSPATNGASAWQWILAFSVLGFLLWLVNKSKIGHAILFYLLVLATISTLLINYRWLASALAPLNGLAGSLSQAGSDLANAASSGNGKGS